MHRFCCALILLLATEFLFSCGSRKNEKKFFDIPGYFYAEIEYIKTGYSTVSKTSMYNGETHTREFKVSDINWKKEFGIFLQCDINKPVYYANMNQTDDGDYWTHSKKVQIQKVDLDYGYIEGGLPNYKIEHVDIELNKTNLISNTKIKAEYHKGHRYKISGEREIKWLGSTSRFVIEGQFSK